MVNVSRSVVSSGYITDLSPDQVYLGALRAFFGSLRHCAKYQHSDHITTPTVRCTGSSLLDPGEHRWYDPRTYVDVGLQCLYYGCGKSKTYCATLYIFFMVAIGGFETGLSLVVRASSIYLAPDARSYIHQLSY
jgi:hypothetical protein